MNVEVAGVVFEFGHLVYVAESLAERRSFVASEHPDHIFDEEWCKASDPDIVQECPGEGSAGRRDFVYGDVVECPLRGTDAGFAAPVGGGSLDDEAFVSVGHGQVEDEVEVVFARDVE